MKNQNLYMSDELGLGSKRKYDALFVALVGAGCDGDGYSGGGSGDDHYS